MYLVAEIDITGRYEINGGWQYRKSVTSIDRGKIDPTSLEIQVIWRLPNKQIMISPCVVLSPRDVITFMEEHQNNKFPIGVEFP